MIKNIITDFDGTLVDTSYANYLAYCRAFDRLGIFTFDERYYDCFGVRFDQLCDIFSVPKDEQLRAELKRLKAKYYEQYFDQITLNEKLVDFIFSTSCNTAIASTASRNNLVAVLRFFNLRPEMFDAIITGEDVTNGKPNPEVYYRAMEKLNCTSDSVLVFEDSEIGISAAQNAGINNIIKVVI